VRGLTVIPGRPGSAELVELPDEPVPDGCLVVDTLLVGVCGTDLEILTGGYGTAPVGEDRLVLGHEAVGRVRHAPASSTWATGDLVVPIVRRPDPVPCGACAAGEWDMCLNGRFTEHGIAGAHGFARDRFALDPTFAVAVPEHLGESAVLVEPASVVAKAWEQITRIGSRAHWEPHSVLITGAGPVGLLAALMARQLGYDTHVLDLVATGPKPDAARGLGATFHTGAVGDVEPAPDIVIECTGVGSVVLDAIEHTARSGIVCLAGLSTGARTVDLDAADLNRRLVLENDAVFGTVNANRRHYRAAVDALGAADPAWLRRLLTRQVLLEDWPDAIAKQPDDIKVALRIPGGQGRSSSPC
jgi:threonine dehydrogenase-like Zn-dependent dehydrogenase